uniref:PIPK domain-containing protein n=1 Tax=Phaeomonas parva TaxID=124430 RepID=A0A7S1U3Z0_9STRA|mmetsp:Transcript_30512/g.97356  ORF Transcript_30512/g.97356 Transcript_30512/m.97356 type:complete len:469 (+) Transcript_30512:364-1770(+)
MIAMMRMSKFWGARVRARWHMHMRNQELTTDLVHPSCPTIRRSTRVTAASYSTAVEDDPKTDGHNEDGITEEHHQYALTYGMMLGIRVSVGRLAMEDHRRQTIASERTSESDDVVDADFEHIDKLLFPPEGNTRPPFITPPHKLHTAFKFKDYSPKIFRAIRKHFGIDESDYMLSLAGDFNFIEFIANSHSGQFFFYSHDGRYMIKTMEKAECKLLRDLLPDYYNHIKNQRQTLMTRFYGMHRVKMRHISKVMHFVIMGSVFHTGLPIHVSYDLKGSTVGRMVSEEERAKGKVRKDQDLLKDERRLQLGPMRETFIEQVERDSQFLARHNIMDYSLLVGVHNLREGGGRESGKRHASVVLTEQEQQRLGRSVDSMDSLGDGQNAEGQHLGPQDVWSQDSGGFQGRAPDGTMQDDIFYMGIIDILQQYNTKKWAENLLKGFKYDRNEISAVRPDKYARRFRDFLAANTI